MAYQYVVERQKLANPTLENLEAAMSRRGSWDGDEFSSYLAIRFQNYTKLPNDHLPDDSIEVDYELD